MGLWQCFLCPSRFRRVRFLPYVRLVVISSCALALSISIPQQAFLDVSSASNPALSYGADGILGLGFDSLSMVDALVNSTGASTGRSLLYNLFQDNPQEPNFIAFSLQSTADSQDNIPGTFSIGESFPANEKS